MVKITLEVFEQVIRYHIKLRINMSRQKGHFMLYNGSINKKLQNFGEKIIRYSNLDH